MLIELTTKITAVIPIACAMTKTIPSASELENASELAKQLYGGSGQLRIRFRALPKSEFSHKTRLPRNPS